MTKGDLGLAVIVLAVVTVFVSYAFAFPLRREHRKTQRYPLFASRHRMVMLVADGKLDEDDEVFQFLYQSVNYLIPQAKHLSHLAILRAAISSPIVKLVDGDFRTHLLDMLSHEDLEVRQVTREFLGIMADKLARIWTVRAAIKLTAIGLGIVLTFLARIERALTPSSRFGHEAYSLYQAVESTNAELATC